MEKYPKQKLDPKWIESGMTLDIVEWTDSFGKHLATKDAKRPMTTGQIRKFYGEVKRIDAAIEKHTNDIPMLKPLLAYAVGRDKASGKNTKIDDFEEELSKAIGAIRLEHIIADYKNFVQIFESIVAYHKYYGGRE